MSSSETSASLASLTTCLRFTSKELNSCELQIEGMKFQDNLRHSGAVSKHTTLLLTSCLSSQFVLYFTCNPLQQFESCHFLHRDPGSASASIVWGELEMWWEKINLLILAEPSLCSKEGVVQQGFSPKLSDNLPLASLPLHRALITYPHPNS